jgi:hypothetical protein
MKNDLIIHARRERLEDTIQSREQTPFPSGREWPFSVAVIDHIVSCLDLSRGWDDTSRTVEERSRIVKLARQVACGELQKRAMPEFG